MKLTRAFLPIVLTVAACSNQKEETALTGVAADNYEAAAANLDALSESNSEIFNRAIESVRKESQPPHNYDFKEGELYGYIAAITEEERKRGKAAGDVLMFAYLGFEDGKHRIEYVNDNGNVVSINECGVPCVAIKRRNPYSDSVSRLAYDSGSLLGAAFEDAINGRLTPKKRPAPVPEAKIPTYERSATATQNSASAGGDPGEVTNEIEPKVDAPDSMVGNNPPAA